MILFKKYTAAVCVITLMLLIATGCKKINVYEKNVSIPGYEWKYSFTPGYDFEITDTAALYNVMVVLRHTDAYRYNNIWLSVTGMLQKDTLVKLPHIEVPLGSDEKGWEGTGMNDIWEVRQPLTRGPVQFKKAGLYHFTIAQVMREDPLPHVMSVGLRIERVK